VVDNPTIFCSSLAMISLKTFLPILSAMIGTTPAVLYERQRALVRLGLLHAVEGRGPGSGVHLSARSLATLIIAYAAADSLADVERRAPQVCAAAADGDHCPDQEQVCPLTKSATFLDALERLLDDPELCRSVADLQIQLNGPEILLTYYVADGAPGLSSFSFGPETKVLGSAIKGIMKTASVSPNLLYGLSDALMGIRMSGALSLKKLPRQEKASAANRSVEKRKQSKRSTK
jgi:hypothetical protein